MATSKQTLKSREDVAKYVAEQITKTIPEDFVVACVEDAIKQNIAHFKISDYEFQQLMSPAVKEKAKELFKTKYAKHIEMQADALAEKLLAVVR